MPGSAFVLVNGASVPAAGSLVCSRRYTSVGVVLTQC